MVPRIVSSIFTRHGKVSDGTKSKGAGSTKGGGLSKGAESIPSSLCVTQPQPSVLFSSIRSLQMRSIALTWEVTYLGSFPVSNVTEDEVSYRINKFKVVDDPVRVQLSINQQCVKVSDDEKVLFNHSLRRILRIIDRRAVCQVAYVASEPQGSLYRRQCHVFHVDDYYQVEEMERVLDNAHRAYQERDSVSRERNEKMETEKKMICMQMAYIPTTPTTPFSEKRTSSTAFLSRLLGSASTKTRDDLSDDTDPKAKRRRRPVSAVFSQALHRFSSSTTSMKRMSTIEVSRTDDCHRRISPPLIEEETTLRESPPRSVTPPPLPQLIFDEKLNEWYYPVDQYLEQQLSKVAYFVKNPQRETVHRQLLAHSPGAFIVRSSDSRKRFRCLALSMRCPEGYSESGIVHYLVLRTEGGYKIKGGSRSFPSIQALCTHYSVMRDHLPCPLVFVQWKDTDWIAAPRKPKVHNIDYPLSCKQQMARQRPMSVDFLDQDENRNHVYIPSHRNSTYRNSRIDYRHSRIIDPDVLP